MAPAFPRCIALLLITAAGCASWHTPEEQRSSGGGLPPPRRHPNGAVLEVAFVSIRPPAAPAANAARRSPPAARAAASGTQAAEEHAAEEQVAVDQAAEEQAAVDQAAEEQAADAQSEAASVPPHAADEHEDIWLGIDETVVAPEVRHALRRNGLRIGKVQRPGDFHRQLARIRRSGDPSTQVLETAEVQSDLSHQARRITCRIGKRYELPVRQPATEDQSVLATLGGQTLGRTLSQAQPLLALRATAVDVHWIKLSLRPEIQHGAMRQTWVGSDAALRIDHRRDAWSFDELTAEIPLEKGGVLVAGCVDPAFGLGQHMFTGTTADGDADQVLMVIRVAELPELIDP